MRRKHVFSLLMLSMGVALLVAATTVGAASSATRKVSSSKALRGGTLQINQSAGAFDTLDPQLAYVTNDWEVLGATQVMLLNYPDKGGSAGTCSPLRWRSRIRPSRRTGRSTRTTSGRV
jgi:hypothetical protein